MIYKVTSSFLRRNGLQNMFDYGRMKSVESESRVGSDALSVI